MRGWGPDRRPSTARAPRRGAAHSLPPQRVVGALPSLRSAQDEQQGWDDVDGSEVRALAARVDALAHGVAEEAAALRSLATTGWTGPAARACEAAVAGRAAGATRRGEDLHETAALLRHHAAAVDQALADLAAAAAAGVGTGRQVASAFGTGATLTRSEGAW